MVAGKAKNDHITGQVKREDCIMQLLVSYSVHCSQRGLYKRLYTGVLLGLLTGILGV